MTGTAWMAKGFPIRQRSWPRMQFLNRGSLVACRDHRWKLLPSSGCPREPAAAVLLGGRSRHNYFAQRGGGYLERNVDRAMSVAHELSIELRAAEDRIRQLEGDRPS
jgi:hypothetical protein